jgi:hypothetical protein
MKIVCYLPSYETPECFYEVASNFLSYNYDLHLKIYTTNELRPELSRSNVTVKTYDKSIRWKLLEQYHNDLLADKDDYDVFMLCQLPRP